MAVDWVFLSIYIAFWIPSTAVFWHNRQNHIVKERGYEWVIFSAVVELYGFIMYAVEEEVVIDCRAFKWPIGNFFLPLWCLPHLVRGTKLYLSFYTARDQLKSVKAEFITSKTMGGSTMGSRSNSQVELDTLLRYKWLNRRGVGALAITAVLVVLTCLAVVIDLYWPTKVTDLTQYGFCLDNLIFNMGIQAFAIMVILSVLVVLLWRVRDAYGIKTEFTLLLILCVVPFLIWDYLMYSGSGLEWGNFHEVHAAMLCFFFVHGIVTMYPLYLIWRSQGAARIDGQLVDSNSNTLADVFNCVFQTDALLKEFERFSVESFNAENITFYKRIAVFLNLPPEKLHSEATRIRLTFLEVGSALELNIDEDVRRRVLDKIDQGNIDKTLFDELKDIILLQLLQDSFLRWIKTESFAKIWRKFKPAGQSVDTFASSSINKTDNETRDSVELVSFNE